MAGVDCKMCGQCGQLLPLTKFKKHSNYRGGRSPHCRKCTNAAAERKVPPHVLAERIEKYREWHAVYRATRAEELRVSKAAHYRRNKDQYIAKAAAWRKANPERLRELARGWQARRRQLKGRGISAGQQAKWAEAQKKVCHWCGVSCAKEFHVDHIQPLSRGGTHELRNLCIACPSCNRHKAAKDPITFARELGKLL